MAKDCRLILVLSRILYTLVGHSNHKNPAAAVVGDADGETKTTDDEKPLCGQDTGRGTADVSTVIGESRCGILAELRRVVINGERCGGYCVERGGVSQGSHKT
ncbi:hypothetical protein E2C01_061845 [Portunus trituberculatus]|uniref:Secreted protein n=1 Tax=Portunus trituberculatus TaxID=210409 RepID=A0A5B7HCB9_PORTR|nr:hypothetical protein [Portunus trituberculatus]